MDAHSFERIASHTSQLGEGLTVDRALPTRARRMIGAWCFLDHVGPVAFGPKKGLHIGAHPHTCLQTFTWMIEGEIRHRDSLGSDQVIRPGEVNLMTAGRGIAHTEDSTVDGQRLHAAQLWIALPQAQAMCPPAFSHHAQLPQWAEPGCRLTLLVGNLMGHVSPVPVHSPLVAADLRMDANAQLVLPLQPEFEHGVLAMTQAVSVDGEPLLKAELAYLPAGKSSLRLNSQAAQTHLLLIGGQPWSHAVVMWWNFVAHSKDVIVQAHEDWQNQSPRFGPVAQAQDRRLAAPALPWPRPNPDLSHPS